MKTVQILAIQCNLKVELSTNNQTGRKDSFTTSRHSRKVRRNRYKSGLNVSHTTAPPSTGRIGKVIEAAPCINSWGSRETRVITMQVEGYYCRSKRED
jgi:hypothetical protein